MTSPASDKRYGRGGGRFVPWDATPAPPACVDCGQPVYGHTGDNEARHRACAAPELDGQTDLFGGAL